MKDKDLELLEEAYNHIVARRLRIQQNQNNSTSGDEKELPYINENKEVSKTSKISEARHRRGRFNPRREREIQKAVEDYAGKELLNLDVIPDPQVPGSFAIKAVYKAFPDKPVFFLISAGDPISWEYLEEVEFESWPPRSGRLRFFGV